MRHSVLAALAAALLWATLALLILPAKPAAADGPSIRGNGNGAAGPYRGRSRGGADARL